MAFSHRRVLIWALICLLGTAQYIHVNHDHDSGHASNALAVFDCSVCLADHFDHSAALALSDAPSFTPAVARPVNPCIVNLVGRAAYSLASARAPPPFLS